MGELPLAYLGWYGEPWERIKVDATTVACPDGTRVPLTDARAFETVGAFNDFRLTQEHLYGRGVELWRAGDEWVGFLSVSESLPGDPPVGLLEGVTHDPKTGRLSLGARLSRGALYRFEGTLTRDRLQGELTEVDVRHPERPPHTVRVVLRRSAESPTSHPTLAAWQQFAQLILQQRGPKW